MNRERKEQEFEALYEHHCREVWALAYARLMNADTAMDITQEAFLRLWTQTEKGESILNPRAWLLRVARNLAEDYGKSAFRRAGTTQAEMLANIPSSDLSPLENVVRHEDHETLRKQIDTLGPKERQVLTLQYFEGYSRAETGRLIGRTPKAIKEMTHRAIEKLRRRLGTPRPYRVSRGKRRRTRMS